MTPVYSMPVIMVTTPGTNCLVHINGMMVGESGNRPALPVAPDGACYLTLYPLSQSNTGVLLPYAVKLEFQKGRIAQGLPYGVHAYCSAKGLIELTITLPFLPVPAPAAAPYAISRVKTVCSGKTIIATLYRDGGRTLISMEDPKEDVQLCLYQVEDLTEGQLVTHPFTTPEGDIVLKGSGKNGHRFLLFSPKDRCQCLIDDYGRGEFTSRALVITRPVGDLCGHEEERSYRMEGHKLLSSRRYGYFTAAPKKLTGAQRCIGLCQCLTLNLTEEAHGMLSPELGKLISPNDLASFFGDFCAIHPLYRVEEEDITLSLCYETELSSCYQLTEYTFTLKDGFVDNIQQAE
ncbi:MAG: hypothetical protein E7328_05570 [Clostridiales bacterium]|nr:hypothetical protein [Clostridiales bacterium]